MVFENNISEHQFSEILNFFTYSLKIYKEEPWVDITNKIEIIIVY